MSDTWRKGMADDAAISKDKTESQVPSEIRPTAKDIRRVRALKALERQQERRQQEKYDLDLERMSTEVDTGDDDEPVA